MPPRNRKKPLEKIVGSPKDKLYELQETANLTQFRVELQRRWPDGGLRTCKTFHQMPPDMIVSMPDWIGAEFGGGNFEAEVTHPLDATEKLFRWGFQLEGEPIEPVRAPKPNAQNPFGAQSASPFAQRQQAPYFGPQMQQPVGVAGYPGMQPNPWNQRPMAPPRDSRVDQQLEQMRQQNDQLRQQMNEQRHQHEMQLQRQENERLIRELKDGTERQIQVLKDELKDSRKSDGGDTMMVQMINMFQQSSQSQQNMMQMFMQRESDASRDQVKAMKDQMLADIEFRRDMYEKLAESKDPKQAAALIDMMGQQTASMLNLVQQAVSTGLLGGQDGDPAWYRAVSQGLESLKEFGNNILSAKQREAAMQGMAGMPQGPRPRFPAPRPGFGQPPGRAMQQVPQVPAGSPQAPAGSPQPSAQPVPGQGAAGPTQQVIEEEEMPEQQPPSLIIPIQNFVMAMQEDYQDPNHSNTRTVADMIYDFVNFMRNNNMLPPEWRSFFEEPAATVQEFLEQFVQPVNPEMGTVSDEYLAELGRHIEIIFEEEGEREEGVVEAEASVTSITPTKEPPTPPASPDEQEPEPETEPEPEPEQEQTPAPAAE